MDVNPEILNLLKDIDTQGAEEEEGFIESQIPKKSIRKQLPSKNRTPKKICKLKDQSTRGSVAEIGVFIQKHPKLEPLLPTTERLTEKTHYSPSDVSQFDSRMSVTSSQPEPEPAPEEIITEEQENFDSPQSSE